MSGTRRAAAAQIQDPLDRLIAHLEVYAPASTPGQARAAIIALRQAQQQVLPPGVNAIGLHVAATRLRQAGARADADEASALHAVAGWLERLARG